MNYRVTMNDNGDGKQQEVMMNNKGNDKQQSNNE